MCKVVVSKVQGLNSRVDEDRRENDEERSEEFGGKYEYIIRFMKSVEKMKK